MSDEITVLETQIIIDASEALKSLNELLKSEADYEDKVSAVSTIIQGLANVTGKSYEQIATFMRQSSAVAGTTNQTISAGLKQVQSDFKGVEDEVVNTDAKLKNNASVAQGWASSFSGAIQTALGINAYQIVNNIINGFQQLIQSGLDYEQVLFKISAASDLWAQRGTPFTGGGLQGQAQDIQNAFPSMSKMDALNGVANLAILTRELGVTQDQTLSFNKAISATSILMGTDLSTAATTAAAAIESGRVQGLKRVGFTIDDNIVLQRAFKMHLEDSNGAIDAQAKRMAILSLIVEQSDVLYAEALKYQDSTPGKVAAAQAAWSNLAVTLGDKASPALANLAVAGDKAFTALNNILSVKGPPDSAFGWIPAAVKHFFDLDYIVTTVLKSIIVLGAAVEVSMIAIRLAVEGNVGKSIEVLQNFGEWYDKAFQQIKKDVLPEAPTATALGGSGAPDDPTSVVDTSKIKSLQDSLLKDLQSYGDQADKITREFYEKEAKLLEDYTQKVSRENQDYEISRQQIIQSANDSISNAEQKHRDDEINAEEKYQLALKELREKYLYDLQGALRNRDAGAVLNLMAQYKMNKDNLTDNYNLEKKQRDDAFRAEMADAKRQEAERLAQLEQEHQIKLQRMEEDYQQQKEQDQQNYQDQQNDLKLSEQRRLEEYSRALAEQLGLNADGAKAIYDLLNQYYGPQGLFDGLYDYSYDSLVAKANAMAQQLLSIYKQYSNAIQNDLGPAPTSGGSGGRNPKPATPMAKGGTLVADSPTLVLMGEDGPEKGTFTPLGSNVSNALSLGEASSSGSSKGSSGSKSEVIIYLDKGLEAKIVEKSMEQLNDVIIQVRRNK